MLTTLSMALALVLTFFVTLARVYPIRRILGYGMALDLGFTVTALAMFHGTLEGMLIATLSGLIMAATITTARALFGYDRATLFLFPFPSLHWTATPPKWRTTLHHLANSRPPVPTAAKPDHLTRHADPTSTSAQN